MLRSNRLDLGGQSVLQVQTRLAVHGKPQDQLAGGGKALCALEQALTGSETDGIHPIRISRAGDQNGTRCVMCVGLEQGAFFGGTESYGSE